jgi:aminobenzoyl-glutamate transport protein
MNEKSTKNNLIARMLNMVERVGNALPHPATLFAIFALLVISLSGITPFPKLSV